MALRGRAVHMKPKIPCIFTHISHFFSYYVDACPGHVQKLEKGLKLNLVHSYMFMRGSALDRNHSPTWHFTWVISPIICSYKVVYCVMSGCTSGVRLQVLYVI